MKLKTSILIIVTTLLVSISSCTGNRIGFGVLLWSAEENTLPSGAVVRIISESRINETYLVKALKDEKQLEISMKKVEFFKKKKEAQNYALSYEPLSRTAAWVSTDGLPIRDTPSSSGTRVYKLKRNQIIKILDKDTAASKEGSLEGYWYETLTEDGVRGYCFSPNLILFDLREGTDKQIIQEEDPYIQALFDSFWRPDFFQTMIVEKKIDPELLKKNYGFVINSENRTISVTIPDFSETFTYTDIVKKGERKFRIEGTPIELAFINTRHFEFVYTDSENMFSFSFAAVNINTDQIIEEEKERREKLFEKIIEKGSILSSSAYGTIEFGSYPSFTWNDYDRLIPQVIAGEAANSGIIDFTIFPSPDLKSSYDGALRFQFTAQGEMTISTFLYEIRETGIRFTYVPEENIRENTIMTVSSSAVIIFFSYPEE